MNTTVSCPTTNTPTTIALTATSHSAGEDCSLCIVIVTLTFAVAVLGALLLGVTVGWCWGRRKGRREGGERECWELTNRRLSEKKLVKESIYDEPSLVTGTTISVAPNQANGHVSLRTRDS